MYFFVSLFAFKIFWKIRDRLFLFNAVRLMKSITTYVFHLPDWQYCNLRPTSDWLNRTNRVEGKWVSIILIDTMWSTSVRSGLLLLLTDYYHRVRYCYRSLVLQSAFRIPILVIATHVITWPLESIEAVVVCFCSVRGCPSVRFCVETGIKLVSRCKYCFFFNYGGKNFLLMYFARLYGPIVCAKN